MGRRGRDSPAGAASGLRGAPSAKLCFRSRKKGYFVLLKWWGRCVGNTTRAATLDSMREVPTWPHAPPAPWPLDTTLASGGNAVLPLPIAVVLPLARVASVLAKHNI